jgi:lipoprotein-anchoring transpeptidase ErfK/SrfK
VAQAAQLLANPLNINAYDPISNESLNWGLPPEEWGRWLVATPDSSSAIGLALTLDAGGLRSYLEGQADAVGANRYLKVDDAVEGIQQAVAQQNMNPVVRVYHHETQHTVQAGETFSSIGYDYGIPYPWIQAANPGVPENLSAGQVVTIPSKDDLLPYPVVPNKRVVVSISQQRTVVYENGQVKWDWPASTGINSSPTAPGIFQIQSHETNAYAANWDLWMPHFMGVYRPVPSSDFMNGFHGFPSRGGYQLLWQNSLGSRVTYGCILLDTNNAKLLYDWAEEGVVVEIQR